MTKLARLSRHSFEKERRQSETLFCVLQTSVVKTSIVGTIEILFLKTDMTCKIENGFYWLVCFDYEYFRTQKLKNVVFQINWHVWANTVLKRGCIHTETLLSERVTGFYWLICFNSWNIRKSCFWSKIILLSSFWKAGMFSFKICLLWQRWVVCKIKNGFNWLIYIHCEYLSAEKFENNVFQAK